MINLNSIIDYNDKLTENPYIYKYNNKEKVITCLSFINFLIVLLLPSGDKINSGIYFLCFTTFLHHFNDKYISFNNILYLLLERLDWFAIIFLGCLFLNINLNYIIILCLISIIRRLKDIIVFILYLYIIIKIVDKDLLLGFYILLVMIIALIYHKNMINNG